MDAVEFKLPIFATLLHLLHYYRGLGNQMKTKKRLTKEYRTKDGKVFDRYNSRDPEMLAADRAFLNYQEQSIPFLGALWMRALFVGPDEAGILGIAWVLFRMAYPVLLGKKLENINPKRVFFATGPCYVITFYMLGDIARVALELESAFVSWGIAVGFVIVAILT